MKTADRKAKATENKAIEDLLYQALETEMGGVQVYTLAVQCARNADLKKEWKEYLEQTKRHVEIVREVFEVAGLDPEATTPGRQIVRDKAKSLLAAMQKALKDAPDAAQIVAAECVVDAETKDHGNWQLIGALADKSSGDLKAALKKAYDQVEDEEDEHLYHTKGWCRELWLEAIGLPAELPPPEEEKDVQSAAQAAKTEEDRKKTLKKSTRRPERGRSQPRA
jgi:rubrerythrin